jgi:hypothetical protein
MQDNATQCYTAERSTIYNSAYPNKAKQEAATLNNNAWQ